MLHPGFAVLGRFHEHHVETANRVPFLRMRHQIMLGGARDSAPLPDANRSGTLRFPPPGPGLHLDKGQHLALARDDVHLVPGSAVIPFKHLKLAAAQKSESRLFAAPPLRR